MSGMLSFPLSPSKFLLFFVCTFYYIVIIIFTLVFYRSFLWTQIYWLISLSNLGSKGDNIRPPFIYTNNVRPPSIPDIQQNKTPDEFDIVPSLGRFYFLLQFLLLTFIQFNKKWLCNMKPLSEYSTNSLHYSYKNVKSCVNYNVLIFFYKICLILNFLLPGV